MQNNFIIPLIDSKFLKRIPFKHQEEGARYILQKKKCILADKMGLGKTYTSLLACESIHGKKLIICPSILKLNWKKEILETRENLVIYIIEGRKKLNLDVKQNSYTIINYEILENHLEELKKQNYDVVILDEAHYIKSVDSYGRPGSKRAKLALEIAATTPFVICITGTPIQSKTKDLYNLLKAVGDPLGRNFYKFSQKYCDAKETPFGRYVDGSSNIDELNIKLERCMIRRDNVNMPEKVRNFIPIKVNLKEYNRKLNNYFEFLRKTNEKNINRVSKLTYINALKMVLEIEKVNKVIQYVDNILLNNESVVIMCNYTESLNRLKDYYKDKAVAINGTTTEREKNDSIDKFQSKKVSIFIGNLKSTGVGINLTASSNMVFCGYPWNSTDLEQAEDRIHRIGQNETCYCHYLYAINAAVDEKLTKMIDKKMKNISSILGDDVLDFGDILIESLKE